jgi:hypothetical protein
VESNAWFKEKEGATLSQSSLSAVAYLYLDPAQGFFVKGGIGLSTLSLDVSGLGGVSESGFGIQGGLGFDINVSASSSLSPFGNLVYGSFEGFSTTVIQLGVGFTWH